MSCYSSKGSGWNIIMQWLGDRDRICFSYDQNVKNIVVNDCRKEMDMNSHAEILETQWLENRNITKL